MKPAANKFSNREINLNGQLGICANCFCYLSTPLFRPLQGKSNFSGCQELENNFMPE